MKEIRCEFSTTKFVDSNLVVEDTVRYYRNIPSVNFDIIHDFLKLFWSHRKTISIINLDVYVDDVKISRGAEERLKSIIILTLEQCDGDIPLTELQMSILIDKVKTVKQASHRRFGGEQEEQS